MDKLNLSIKREISFTSQKENLILGLAIATELVALYKALFLVYFILWSAD